MAFTYPNVLHILRELIPGYPMLEHQSLGTSLGTGADTRKFGPTYWTCYQPTTLVGRTPKHPGLRSIRDSEVRPVTITRWSALMLSD